MQHHLQWYQQLEKADKKFKSVQKMRRKAADQLSQSNRRAEYITEQALKQQQSDLVDLSNKISEKDERISSQVRKRQQELKRQVEQ
jgi:F0F1-type ATP synthase membrane subunit b/b'